MVCINARKNKEKIKKKKGKGIKVKKVKPSIPSQAIDPCIGDDEQNGKQKKENLVPPMTHMDHTVGLF